MKQQSKRFAVMKKFTIGPVDNPYLVRWRIIQTPVVSLYLHKMYRGDRRPIIHDHPWSFFSIVLWGGYNEVKLNQNERTTYEKEIKYFNFIRCFDGHYISSLRKKTAWTLLFVGPRVRQWGYWIEESNDTWIWDPWYNTKEDAA